MRLKTQPNSAPSADIALRFIRFLAADEDRLAVLVGLTGLGPQDFAARAEEPEFQAFVLDYGLENESLLLEFVAAEGLRPEALLQARRRLPGAAF